MAPPINSSTKPHPLLTSQSGAYTATLMYMCGTQPYQFAPVASEHNRPLFSQLFQQQPTGMPVNRWPAGMTARLSSALLRHMHPALPRGSPQQHMQATQSTMSADEPADLKWHPCANHLQHSPKCPTHPRLAAADQPMTSSYRGCQGLSAGRCAQLSGSQVDPGADSTTCSAHECRETGEVFSALRQGQRAHVHAFERRV
jgi:hypothetical protein